MRVNGLYDTISSIIEIYNNGYTINENNNTDIKTRFGCYNTSLSFNKKDDYVELRFKGSFPAYLIQKDEVYYVKVFNNDKVKHNIGISRRYLLDGIINYVNNEVYIDACEYDSKRKLEEIKKLEEKRNMNPNVEKYKNCSKEILFNLGTTQRTDDLYNDREPVRESCSYSGFGLDIVAYNLPGYVYEDGKGGLRPFIKDHMKNICISYEGERVLDTKDNTYNRGNWELIFAELYNKLPFLKERKDNNYKRRKHCVELMDEVIDPLLYRNIYAVNELEIGKYTEHSYRMNSCGSCEDDYHYYVKKNGEEVFHVVEEGWHNYSVYTYFPGIWEDELKYKLDCYDIERKQKKDNKSFEYIKQLRDLK